LQEIVKYVLHGIIMCIVSLALMFLLSSNMVSFITYNPPIGTGLLIFSYVFVVPFIVGVVNALVVKKVWDVEFGWYSFYVNGLMLFLLVSSMHMILNYALNSYMFAVVLTVIFSPLLGFIGKYFEEE